MVNKTCKRCESAYQQAAENVSKAKSLKIGGSKAELIDRVLTHERGNLSPRDAVEDEESPIWCEDDASSESSDSDDSSNDCSHISIFFYNNFIAKRNKAKVISLQWKEPHNRGKYIKAFVFHLHQESKALGIKIIAKITSRMFLTMILVLSFVKEVL